MNAESPLSDDDRRAEIDRLYAHASRQVWNHHSSLLRDPDAASVVAAEASDVWVVAYHALVDEVVRLRQENGRLRHDWERGLCGEFDVLAHQNAALRAEVQALQEANSILGAQLQEADRLERNRQAWAEHGRDD